MNARQLNWRPDDRQWSVGQCLEHLLAANELMLRSAATALDSASGRSVWQRLPLLPRVWGRLLVRSQAPDNTRKFVAAAAARPSESHIAPDVVERFLAQHQRVTDGVAAVNERDAARAIMVSPFATFITYSVLDGWRLIAAHDRRHLEQARRVTHSAGFPPERLIAQ